MRDEILRWNGEAVHGSLSVRETIQRADMLPRVCARSIFKSKFLRHFEDDSIQTRKMVFFVDSSSLASAVAKDTYRFPHSCLSNTYRSRLRLRNEIASHHSRANGALLNSRGFLKTVRVDTTKEFFGKIHSVKGFNGFIPVRIKVRVGQTAGGSFSASFFISRFFTANSKQRE